MQRTEFKASSWSQNARITHGWPQPVAARWQRMLITQEAQDRAVELAVTNGALIRLLWCYAVAHHLAHDEGDTTLVAALLDAGRSTSDGVWVQQLDRLIGERAHVPSDAVIFPMVRWWRKQRVAGKKIRACLDALVGYRNRVMHSQSGDTRAHQERTRAFDQETRALYHSAGWMQQLRSFQVLGTTAETRRTSGDLRWLTGIHASVDSPVSSSWGGRLVKGATYLVDLEKPASVLQVDPLFFVGRLSSAQSDAILLFSDLRGREDPKRSEFSSSRDGQTGPAEQSGTGRPILREDLVKLLSTPDAERKQRLHHLSPLPGQATLSRVIDRFVLKEVLGKGGMAIVSRAYDKTQKREVAIKILNEEGARHPTVRARFVRESRQLQQLRHPNVMPIYQDGTTGAENGPGRPFYTMPVAKGSLGELFASGGYDAAALRRWGGDALRGLSALHDAELVHRDMKPQNLLFVEGRLVVADLGVVRELDGDTLATRDDAIGTDGFMAPEVLRGSKATKAADIYSLGMTLLYGLERCSCHDSLLDRLLRKMVASDAQDRPSVEEALKTMEAMSRHALPNPSGEADTGLPQGGESSTNPSTLNSYLSAVAAIARERRQERLLGILHDRHLVIDAEQVLQLLVDVQRRHKGKPREEIVHLEGESLLLAARGLTGEKDTNLLRGLLRRKTAIVRQPGAPHTLSGGQLAIVVRDLVTYQRLVAALWDRDPRDSARLTEFVSTWEIVRKETKLSLLQPLRESALPELAQTTALKNFSAAPDAAAAAILASAVATSAYGAATRNKALIATGPSAGLVSLVALWALRTPETRGKRHEKKHLKVWHLSDVAQFIRAIQGYYAPIA